MTDITLDGFSVTEINVGELAFSPDAVLSSSDDVMIVNDTGEKIRLVPPKTRIPDPVEAAGIKAVISSAAPKATAMPEVAPSRSAIDGEAEPSDETPGGENAPDIPEKPILPGKIPYSNVSVTKSPLTGDAKRAGYAFLIGKLVTKTLTADDGGIVVEAGSRVTEDDLSRTEQAGKLVQLALHTK